LYVINLDVVSLLLDLSLGSKHCLMMYYVNLQFE